MMKSQIIFHYTNTREIRIELSDLTLFGMLRDQLKKLLRGKINLLEMDSLLYLLHFAEFQNGLKDRKYLKEAECIMRSGAYETDFGYNYLGNVLGFLRSRLRYDYFIRGSIILTHDNLLVNDKLYILPILD